MGGMKAMVFGDKPAALLGRQAALYEIEVIIFVFAVNLVADDGMTNGGEVDADLMFAAGEQNHAQEREGAIQVCELTEGEDLRGGGQACGADTIFDGDAAVRVRAERSFNKARAVELAVDNRKIFFVNGAGFPEFAEAHSGFEVFGNDDDAACFAIEAVDEMSFLVAQVEANTADEAGINVAFGRVTNEPRRFVDDEEIIVFGDDIEEMFHRVYFNS